MSNYVSRLQERIAERRQRLSRWESDLSKARADGDEYHAREYESEVDYLKNEIRKLEAEAELESRYGDRDEEVDEDREVSSAEEREAWEELERARRQWYRAGGDGTMPPRIIRKLEERWFKLSQARMKQRERASKRPQKQGNQRNARKSQPQGSGTPKPKPPIPYRQAMNTQTRSKSEPPLKPSLPKGRPGPMWSEPAKPRRKHSAKGSADDGESPSAEEQQGAADADNPDAILTQSGEESGINVSQPADAQASHTTAGMPGQETSPPEVVNALRTLRELQTQFNESFELQLDECDPEDAAAKFNDWMRGLSTVQRRELGIEDGLIENISQILSPERSEPVELTQEDVELSSGYPTDYSVGPPGMGNYGLYPDPLLDPMNTAGFDGLPDPFDPLGYMLGKEFDPYGLNRSDLDPGNSDQLDEGSL